MVQCPLYGGGRATTSADGSPGKQAGGHTHSYLGTLRGLLLYGELTGQSKYVDIVALTYIKTVRTRLKKSCFISHDMDKDRNGEPTSPGDISQLALWLATRHGYTEFFDDVERIVRARLIPCQITQVQSLKQPGLAPLRILGDYALVPRDKLSNTIELQYSLPVSTEIERTDNIDYTINWRGDEIMGISPNSDFYPFYPGIL
jgi:hypothetical protein